MEGALSSYVKEIMSGRDYELWFSDRLSQKYVGSLPLRYSMAVCDEQKRDIAGEASSVLGIYSLLVYYVYPNSKGMRERISADKELSANFSLVSGWLDANGGKRIADEVLANVSGQGEGEAVA